MKYQLLDRSTPCSPHAPHLNQPQVKTLVFKMSMDINSPLTLSKTFPSALVIQTPNLTLRAYSLEPLRKLF